jgi:hypothetical protein
MEQHLQFFDFLVVVNLFKPLRSAEIGTFDLMYLGQLQFDRLIPCLKNYC